MSSGLHPDLNGNNSKCSITGKEHCKWELPTVHANLVTHPARHWIHLKIRASHSRKASLPFAGNFRLKPCAAGVRSLWVRFFASWAPVLCISSAKWKPMSGAYRASLPPPPPIVLNAIVGFQPRNPRTFCPEGGNHEFRDGQISGPRTDDRCP